MLSALRNAAGTWVAKLLLLLLVVSFALGWALYENMVYDEAGQPLTASWMDYTMPHIHQSAKTIETVLVEVPSDYGPFGAKGVGEAGVTGSMPWKWSPSHWTGSGGNAGGGTSFACAREKYM